MAHNFSQVLKELRADKKLSQLQLANNLNYTQGVISGWESGTVEPKATALLTIAHYFGVSIGYLLGVEDDFGAPTAAPMGDNADLTEKEKALLKAFKNLLPETQDFVLRTAQSLSDKSNVKTLNKN